MCTLNRFKRLCLAVLLPLLAPAFAVAQSLTPTTSSRSWNTYVPSVIPSTYATIIANGGTRFPNSESIGGDSFNNLVYTLEMPFAFRFMDEEYAVGHPLLVSTSGYLSFNNSQMGSPNGTSWQFSGITTFDMLGTFGGTPAANTLIMPYAANLATSLPSGDGGVYWAVTGTSPNRVLTIEWRGQLNFQFASDGSIGNFQARLFEKTGTIEYHYGESSITAGWLDFTPLVGLKKRGEDLFYNDWSGLPTGHDFRQPREEDRYYLFNNPRYGQGDSVAITGMRVGDFGGNGMLEFVPFFGNPVGDPTGSPYGFHYEFPTDANGNRIGYRLSPVTDDVRTDTVVVLPSRPMNAYQPGSEITVRATFTNQGRNTRQNVPVQVDYYRDGVLVHSSEATVFGGRGTEQFGSETITFERPIGRPFTDTNGVLEARVYPKFDIDQDPTNDTARATFYISAQRDVMPLAILEPHSNTAPLFQKYPIGVVLPVEVRYLNIGLQQQRNVTVGIVIVDASGAVVHRDSTTFSGTWDPLTTRDWLFRTWTPTRTGAYAVRAWSSLPGDEYIPNDSLPRRPGYGKNFEVRHEVEVAALAADRSTHSPMRAASYPIGKPVRVAASFGNTGASDATNIPVRLRITAPNGTIVYDRTALVLDITSDNGRAVQRFAADFTPQVAGTYCVSAFSEYAQEPIRSNDTARWCFTVKPALAGTIRVGMGERFKSLEEARDSLFYYGVAGPVTFELTNDRYVVEKREKTTPALDFRGRIVGV
ncbi:MAG TPA: hypothetical protein VNA88_16385, partial [Candidatus Kapabacteria bacterium]|nr:hypothetical protein [Candidatus Kapabacteria bacterium]